MSALTAPETMQLWVKLVATMGSTELADFEARTFKECDRASLSALRIAIRPATARARRLTRMRRRLFGRRHAASRHGRYRDSARVARQKPLHQG